MKRAPVQTDIQKKDGGLIADWTLWLNTLVMTVTRNELQALPVFANNADALAGNLKAGDPYRTATGQVMVVY
jgi:hypothetical protein